MFWLKHIRNFITILNSNASPAQVSWGIALGAIVGIMPFKTLLSFFLFLIILLLNVNWSAAMLAIAVFSIISIPLDILSHAIGYALLSKVDALLPLWTRLYNLPIVPFTRFNNSVVLGGLVLGIILIAPNYLIFKRLIVIYRERLQGKVQQSRLFKTLGLTKFFEWYTKFMADS
jgi:uncharacterized protein (TIGR03546 family)